MRPSFRGLSAAFFVAALTGGFAATLHAAGEGWLNDWEAAKKQAAAEKKDILVDFTGSDWCGWCIRLDKEVFSEDAFKAAAKEKYVLVALDFPQNKQLPDAEQAQNKKLQETFAVEGFPTIFLTDAEGRPFGRTGYRPGGAEVYVKHLGDLTAAKVKRDEAFASAASSSGLNKAKALKAALESLPDDLGTLEAYAGVLDEIKTLDKEDTLGLAKAAAARKARNDLEHELQGLARDGQGDAIPARVDAFLKENPQQGEDLQKIHFMKLMSVDRSSLDKANPILDAIIEIDATSDTGKQAASLKERIAAMLEAQAAEENKETSEPGKKPAESEDKSAE